jgi:glycosyltransferase involved in cell wall biosynthesis
VSRQQHKPVLVYKRILLLTNVYDDNYKLVRGEDIPTCLSSPKRRDLHDCLASATCTNLLIVSSPPRALKRRAPRWLPSILTRFGRVPQVFASNYDARFVRTPLSWFFYVLKVVRTVNRSDLLIIDNYEFIYVLAARIVQILYGVPIVLEYEDGKHLTDKGWHRVLSGAAELLAKPYISGAILAQPSLSNRLPSDLPFVVVPGFVVPSTCSKLRSREASTDLVRFVYSGTLDRARGLELLLEAVRMLPPHGWTLDITGDGPLASRLSQMASSRDLANRVVYHQVLTQPDYNQLLNSCDIGLNLQMSSDPISAVTFPSKVFSYLSYGLQVVSSSASGVSSILRGCCFFYTEDTARSVADTMMQAMHAARYPDLKMQDRIEYFGIEQTSRRMRLFFQRAGIKFT